MTGWHATVEHGAAAFGRGVEAGCVLVLGLGVVLGAVWAAVRWRARG